MADTQPIPSTPSTQKAAIKPEQYVPMVKPTTQTEPEKADVAAKTARPTAPRADQTATSGPKLKAVTITIDADSADVLRVEGIDAKGARHDLSDEEKASLVNLIKDGRREERLEEALEHAFEAGIACVLGDDDEEDDDTTQESAADAALRHRLLAPLIKRSAIRHLTERAALNRAILGTLIEHSATH